MRAGMRGLAALLRMRAGMRGLAAFLRMRAGMRGLAAFLTALFFACGCFPPSS